MDQFKILFGLLDVTNGEQDQERFINHIERHPDYVKNNLNHDVALVKLDKKLKFNENVGPANLPCGGTPIT